MYYWCFSPQRFTAPVLLMPIPLSSSSSSSSHGIASKVVEEYDDDNEHGNALCKRDAIISYPFAWKSLMRYLCWSVVMKVGIAGKSLKTSGIWKSNTKLKPNQRTKRNTGSGQKVESLDRRRPEKKKKKNEFYKDIQCQQQLWPQ